MVFKSLKHKLSYKLNGYFVIKDFLNEEQLEKLSSYYKSLNLYANARVSSYGVYTNNKEDLSATKNKEIDEYIKEVCSQSMQRYFKKYKVGGGIFLLKGPGEDIVPMHQDWNMVDEEKSISFAIWSPLIDVDEQNGCLHVIPGSHHWFKNFRSSTISSVFMPLNKLGNHLKSIPIKKGYAVIYAHSLFHGSLPNKSGVTRPTICLSVLPIDAKPINIIRKGEQVNIVSAGEAYYIDALENSQHDKELILKTIPYKEHHQLSETQFWQKHNQLGIKKTLVKWFNFFSR